MYLEVAHWYELASKSHPYTHKLQAKIPSLGTRYGLLLPDILLTVLYRLDAKGNIVENVKLIYQPDGPNDAELNFKHETLQFKYTFSVCRFDVNMDVLFGEGVIIKKSATLGGSIGEEKKYSLEASAEIGEDSPGTRTTIHGRRYGMIAAKENRLDAWGELV